ncbi:MAG: hypothetical protein A2068_06965 [Ignavibacteria bacterium GWB2_35_6b]|nr:MAG: hypothetical protein A2068_06965 [Ignavibacteria bacterium GWB2_35_6b]
MNKTIYFFAALMLLLISKSFAQTQYADPFTFEFKKINESIYVAWRPDHLKQIVEGNSIIIINEKDVVVVDATGSPRGARQIVAKIKELTDKPVRYLINTHGHGDHTLGNQEFVKSFPGCEIISHPETRKYMLAPKGSTGAERGIAYVYEWQTEEGINARKKSFAEYKEEIKKEAKPGYEIFLKRIDEFLDHDMEIRRQEYMDVIVTPPTLTVENKLTLYRGEREIQIMFLGKGDTPGDIWVYLPKEKILCTGDAVVNPIPYGYTSVPIEWLETLKKVREEINFDIMIPGHGDVQYDNKYLSLLIEVMTSIQKQVKEAVDKGLTLEQTYEFVNISDIENKFTKGDYEKTFYFEGWFKQPNISNTYNELTKK